MGERYDAFKMLPQRLQLKTQRQLLLLFQISPSLLIWRAVGLLCMYEFAFRMNGRSVFFSNNYRLIFKLNGSRLSRTYLRRMSIYFLYNLSNVIQACIICSYVRGERLFQFIKKNSIRAPEKKTIRSQSKSSFYLKLIRVDTVGPRTHVWMDNKKKRF